MRRILRFFRRPFVILLIFLLVGWSWFFYTKVPPLPKYIVSTGAAFKDDPRAMRPTGTSASIRHLSDDGSEVVIAIYEGDFRFPKCKLERWNAQTKTNQTPEFWKDPKWQAILSGGYLNTSGIMDLFEYASGKNFLSDEAAWKDFRKRLEFGRTKAVDDCRKTIGPVDDDVKPDLFLKSLYFSPDGKYIAYVSRNGWPAYLVHESLGDGTTIEDARTGQRMGFLPQVTNRIIIAPGGRTAVSRNFPEERKGEQPNLILWDLDTSTQRSQLFIADNSPQFEYSPDGRYVFADCTHSSESGFYLRWWDTATGNLVNTIERGRHRVFIDGGRTLVTHPSKKSRDNGLEESYLLCFWDIDTGSKIGEWQLDSPSEGEGIIWNLVSSKSGRYLGGEFNSEYGRSRRRIGNRIVHITSTESEANKEMIILWDMNKREEITRIPGRSTIFSQNEQWLATIDHDGIVRVWELPLSPDWELNFWKAGKAGLVSWVVLLFLILIIQQFRKDRNLLLGLVILNSGNNNQSFD
jgi:WD40 repeat protein